MSAHTNPHDTNIDPRLAVALNPVTSAQERARALLAENAQLLRVLGAVLVKTGPIEIDQVHTAEGVVYEVSRYESFDGLTDRWVAARVKD